MKTKFDNRKKIDFFKTIIDFWKKTKLTSLDRVRVRSIISVSFRVRVRVMVSTDIW